MADQKIKIRYYGEDYTPINDCICQFESEVDENIASKKQKIKILEIFLKSVDNDYEKYIVNKSTENKFDKKKNKLFDYYNGVPYFSGCVGVISNKDFEIPKSELLPDIIDEDKDANKDDYHFDIILQINSRLDKDRKENISKKPYFLSTLLLDGDVELNDDNIPNSYDELFDYLLLIWFKRYLQEAFVKGYYRTYRRFEGNDDRPKGTIDVARHIKLNMGQRNGKIAYSYRENSVDNYLNHLVMEAYEYLKKKYYNFVVKNFDSNYELKSLIDNLKIMIGYPKFSTSELIYKNIKPIAHPYFLEYEELRQVCLKILRDEGVSVFDGYTDNETDGILFYMPDLWEQFLEKNVLDFKSGIRVKSQETINIYCELSKSDESKDKTTQKSNESNDKTPSKPTRPDFIFYYTNEEKTDVPFMILDAKFKPQGEDNPNFLDDYTKCIRDAVDINGVATGVIYPKNIGSESNDDIKYKTWGTQYNTWLKFYQICIGVPYVEANEEEEDSYNAWKEKFEQQVEQGSEKIEEIVKENKEYYENEKVKNALEELKKNRETKDCKGRRK